MAADPEFYTATLAWVYANQGYLDKARDIFQTLLERSPERQDLKEGLAEVERRRAAQPAKTLEDVAPLFQRWVELQLQLNHVRQLRRLKRKCRQNRT